MLALWWRLVNAGFDLLYNRLAWTYDAVSWAVSLGAWRQWQSAALTAVAGSRVLELAHGTGHLLPRLAQRGGLVVGLDRSPAMGRIARRRLQRHALALPLLRAAAEALPFAAASFDTLVTTFPAPFILDPATLRGVARLLRPGGRLVIVPGGYLTGRSPLHRLIALAFALTGQRVAQDGSGAAETAWDDWRAALAAAGLTLTVQPVALPGSRTTLLIATRAA